MNTAEEQVMVGFKVVPPKQRQNFYPSLVASMRWMMVLENSYYGLLERNCQSYRGGYFDFIEYPNGAKAPSLDMTSDEKVEVISQNNFFHGEMRMHSLATAGFAIICNHLAHHTAVNDPKTSEKMTKNWQLLMEVLMTHEIFEEDRDAIIQFLD